MRIEASGRYIIDTYYEVLEFDIKQIDTDSLDGNDFVEEFDFDYGKIFELLTADLGLEYQYETPTDTDEFNNSPLWVDLGFQKTKDFEVFIIYKFVEIKHDMTRGQKAGLLIDINAESVTRDISCVIYNELDLYTFEWRLHTPGVYSYSGGEIIDDIINIYVRFSRKEISAEQVESEVRDYLRVLSVSWHEFEPIPTSDINIVVGIVSKHCKE